MGHGFPGRRPASVIAIWVLVEDADGTREDVLSLSCVVLHDQAAVGVDPSVPTLADRPPGPGFEAVPVQGVTGLPRSPHGVRTPRQEGVMPFFEPTQERCGKHVAVDIASEDLA
jgi:hypothetical protein